MNEYELSQARKLKKHQEAMRDPVYAAAYEAAERRRKERERSEEILKYYAGNGCLPRCQRKNQRRIQRLPNR